MPSAGILCFDGCYASVVGGFADLMQVANAHLKKSAPQVATYTWDFLSTAGGGVRASNGMDLSTRPIPPRKRYDVVFIPSFHYRGKNELSKFIGSCAPAAQWLQEQWAQGAYLAANCTGTFVLASTGLLNNRRATTTWWLEQSFRDRFPDVQLQMHPLVTEEDRLICAGAHAAFLTQTVRVLSQFSGAAIGTQCARSMLIDVTQSTQTMLLPLMSDRAHNDALVHRAEAWLHKRMHSDVRLSEMADELAVTQRTLTRRFQSARGQSPLAFLQNMRIDAARALLETGSLSIEQICAYVGYADTSSFTRLFRARVGLTPGNYRDRFNASPAQ
ncbi:helix-turn-helix domain-containing protein [Curvibacter sp. APW13]|uniref:GlxA family transcriptional regulator n=1 Tax=Curvibacter sp. APW13 TaxID=3077236 RepID=UPI0028E05174|nr:helix-turn-helix domain-containing protein [Curvibacter sp. APW13]MDT8989338.1 helix-turn-helix domain-containing protein [Curvibacter sp. APW13]